ncbi:MAG TPA: DNA (cytosine-5-)-methyltransferase [Terriglobia bacterium]|nr:DNA (cytosine-5-)-methyltransferase [Terriglobia bacterium]
MRFIDLFAGLGGFHLALKRLGNNCVFASEIDTTLRELYEANYGIRPAGDILSVPICEVPDHDILCAGSPCQPFSKAGEQQGVECPKWGNLLGHMLRIARARKPRFILLENVPNLKRHNGGETWEDLERQFQNAGYAVAFAYLSPHQFGIPQIRERMFIVGSRDGLGNFRWPVPPEGAEPNLSSALDHNPKDARRLTPAVLKCLDVWQKFIEKYPANIELPSFPIWSMEFGATYPYEDTTPWATPRRDLFKYRGSHGESLKCYARYKVLGALPSHARTPEKRFPTWKRTFIRQNRNLYCENKEWIDRWLPEIVQFPPSLQKFEWNCKGEERNIWKYVIQFRASGVRVKRPTTAPSLIAMTTTQVPIIAWERRYMTVRECARLQCMDELKHLPAVPTQAFKALGNGVNTYLVELIAEALIKSAPVTTQTAAATRLRLKKEPSFASTAIVNATKDAVSLVEW